MGRVMGQVVAPKSLRSFAAIDVMDDKSDAGAARAASAVAGLIAVASFSGAAEAQQSSLPPEYWIDSPHSQ